MAAPSRAVLLALELHREPSLAEAARRQDLPNGIEVVIRIAGGCESDCLLAAQQTGASAALLREAAGFYLQHTLLQPKADSYRVLGGVPTTPVARLRANRNWLLRWLHPDRNPGGWESAFVQRVLRAWDDVKTPQRRARYDRRLSATRGRAADMGARSRRGRPWFGKRPHVAQARRGRRRRIGIAACVGVAVLLVPGPELPSPWVSGAAVPAAAKEEAAAERFEAERANTGISGEAAR